MGNKLPAFLKEPRENTQIPNIIWEQMQYEILESGLESMIRNYQGMGEDGNLGKVEFPYDIIAQEKMQKVIDSMDELEKYLEVDKYLPDQDWNEAE